MNWLHLGTLPRSEFLDQSIQSFKFISEWKIISKGITPNYPLTSSVWEISLTHIITYIWCCQTS